jgi:hypothetical protein
VTAAEWLRAFCEEIGEPAPSEAEIDEILKLASVAAHASERKAAPVACYIAGRNGRPVGELLERAETVGGS